MFCNDILSPLDGDVELHRFLINRDLVRPARLNLVSQYEGVYFKIRA